MRKRPAKTAPFTTGTTRVFAFAALAILGLAGCGGKAQKAKAEANQPSAPPDPANTHVVSVTFDYDFKKNPPCAPNSKSETCVKKFDVYDVSGGSYKLFSIPVPAGASGFMKGIAGKSSPRQFEPGMHFIAVTAENAGGAESNVNAGKVSVMVTRKSLPGAASTSGH